LVLRVLTSLGLQLAIEADDDPPTGRHKSVGRAYDQLDRIIAEATRPTPSGSLG
jgi:hypothetical protein